jgi:hypothetical protein
MSSGRCMHPWISPPTSVAHTSLVSSAGACIHGQVHPLRSLTHLSSRPQVHASMDKSTRFGRSHISRLVRRYMNDHPMAKAAQLSPEEVSFRYDGLTSLFDLGLDFWWCAIFSIGERQSQVLQFSHSHTVSSFVGTMRTGMISSRGWNARTGRATAVSTI